MTEWEDLLPEIAETFGGQLPYPETADDIRAAYQRAPQTVTRMADAVAALYADGTAQNPWGMLRYRVKAIPEHDPSKPSASGSGRDKAIARAEQWMRTAGLHHDRETELLDELYGERGRLRHHPETRDRMLQLWHELRPLGELADHEAAERGQRYAQQRKQLATTPAGETPEQRLQRQRETAAHKAGITTDTTTAALT